MELPASPCRASVHCCLTGPNNLMPFQDQGDWLKNVWG